MWHIPTELSSAQLQSQTQSRFCLSKSLPRVVIFLIVKLGRGFSQLSLCMYYMPSIHFLLPISVPCHLLNLPLDHNTLFFWRRFLWFICGAGGWWLLVIWLGSMDMILSFVSDSFFFFLLYSLVVFFCLTEAARESRMERKRQGYFYTQNFILGFKTIPWHKTFSWTSRNSRISQTRCWNILFIFGEVCIAEVTTSRRHSWHQAQDLVNTCAILLAAERKKSFQSLRYSLMRKFLFQHQEAPLFRHAWILLPARASWELLLLNLFYLLFF